MKYNTIEFEKYALVSEVIWIYRSLRYHEVFSLPNCIRRKNKYFL